MWSCRPDDLPSATASDLISDRPNRWNAKGEATIYLSGDPALALLEIGRHPQDARDELLVVEVEVDVPRAIDLRDTDVIAALSLPRDNAWVLDRERTRQVARSLRDSGTCDGLIVPSAGALDQPDRWNLVVFADDRARVSGMVGLPRPAGEILVSATR